MAPRERPRDSDLLAPTGVIAPTPIEVESPVFTGSLAMLFACVRERKINLAEVPLFPVCAAYYTYLISTEQVDLDQAAAGLSALCYLIERKAWLLLPTPEPEPEMDVELELPMPTITEYESAILILRQGLEERSLRFFRPAESGPNIYELPYELTDVSVQDLAVALEVVLQRAHPEPIETAAKPLRSLSEQMVIIMGRLNGQWLKLQELLEENYTRREAVWTFLALLELIRLGQCKMKLADESVSFAKNKAYAA